jgi:hypothetical protein
LGVTSARDMDALALFLIANWLFNGETVFIDGGVSCISFSLFSFTVELKSHENYRPS